MMNSEEKWLEVITDQLPEGYSEREFQRRRYGVTKTAHNEGRSLKIYAEELGGKDYISLNLYFLDQGPLLKPCEMSESKVKNFLSRIERIEQSKNR